MEGSTKLLGFSSPDYLYLLFLVPVSILLFWLTFRHIRAVRRQLNLGHLMRLSRVAGVFRFSRLMVLYALGITSLIVALAEPHIVRTRDEPIYKKINLVFILDRSLSMRTRDIVPSRLARARQEIQNFILNRSENIGQIGLVSFAGSSTILSYLTEDVSNILFYLDFIQTDMRLQFGTDIGSATKNALLLLEQEQQLEPTLRPSDFIFILVSDGEDHGEELRTNVRIAADLGVRIYTLGLGSQMGGYIPLGEKDGRTVFLVNEEGDRVLAAFDEGTLRMVADQTRAQYYRSYSGSDLYQNLNAILRSEMEEIGTREVTDRTSLHYWFVIAGFSALALFLFH